MNTDQEKVVVISLVKSTIDASDNKIVLRQTAKAWTFGTKYRMLSSVLFGDGGQRSFIIEDLF